MLMKAGNRIGLTEGHSRGNEKDGGIRAES